MTAGRPLRRLGALLALVVVPAMAGTVARHLKLLRSEPLANTTVAQSPVQVKLWFSQRPELAVTSVRITSGTGAQAAERTLAPLGHGTADDAPITAPIGAALAPGHYEVVWRTMARDGHVLNGVIPFDVARAPAAR